EGSLCHHGTHDNSRRGQDPPHESSVPHGTSSSSEEHTLSRQSQTRKRIKIAQRGSAIAYALCPPLPVLRGRAGVGAFGCGFWSADCGLEGQGPHPCPPPERIMRHRRK